MGNGLLTFIDKKTYLNNFFTNKEMIFYESLEDLAEKIKRYSKNDKDWRKIAKNGHRKYHKFFNSTIIANYIVNKTQGLVTNNYWE